MLKQAARLEVGNFWRISFLTAAGYRLPVNRTGSNSTGRKVEIILFVRYYFHLEFRLLFSVYWQCWRPPLCFVLIDFLPL